MNCDVCGKEVEPVSDNPDVHVLRQHYFRFLHDIPFGDGVKTVQTEIPLRCHRNCRNTVENWGANIANLPDGPLRSSVEKIMLQYA